MEEKWIMYLKKNQENEYKFEGVDKGILLNQLLEAIGDRDGEIRDGLVYPNLAHLLHDGHFDEEKLNEITKLLISERYLHFDIENYIEDSVLTRSFTLLQLVILVYVHNRDHIIHGKIIRNLYTSFLDYFEKEEDFRGYNDQVGWLHSIAHSADLFAQLMKIESFHESELKTMFTRITDKYKSSKFFFMYDEDERMIDAIMNGLERDVLDEEFVTHWLESFSNYKKISEYPQAYYLTNNIKVFLRSLYFKVLDKEKYEYIAVLIQKLLKENVKLR